MLGKFLLRASVTVSLMLAAPAMAQGGGAPAEETEALEALSELFAAEPLTAEQEARLPLAREVVATMMPPGTMAEMMGGMFDKIMGPIMQMEGQISSSDLAEELGVETFERELSENEVEEVSAILDPHREERVERLMAVFPEIMGRMMGAMEPAMRDAMAEAYAVYFDQTELAVIGRFFATPSGANYARKSFTMSTNPRFLGAMMKSMPEMMGSFASFEEEMKAAEADLPQPKTYADLTVAELARLSALTGLDREAIREGMEIREEAAEDGE